MIIRLIVICLISLFWGCDPVATKQISLEINRTEYQNLSTILLNSADITDAVKIVEELANQYKMIEFEIPEEYKKKYRTFKVYYLKMPDHVSRKCSISISKDKKYILVKIVESITPVLSEEAKEMAEKIYKTFVKEFGLDRVKLG